MTQVLHETMIYFFPQSRPLAVGNSITNLDHTVLTSSILSALE